jgi:hypothetical protein
MHRIKGTITEKATLQGTLNAPAKLRGSLNDIQSLSGTITQEQYDTYSGEIVVIPKTVDQILETGNKVSRNDILVEKIPTFETSNEYGVTFIIAS